MLLIFQVRHALLTLDMFNGHAFLLEPVWSAHWSSEVSSVFLEEVCCLFFKCGIGKCSIPD